MTDMPYDAILVVSFGGPDQGADVMPFLENVLRGKPVPRERMLEVAEHYHHFGGVSPINAQCREFISLLRTELDSAGIDLPVYWGNRNWHPLLADVLGQMQRDGVRRVLAFVTSAYSSYSGCRQYRENIYAACDTLGEGAPVVDKIRVFYNHPEFIAVNVDHIRQGLHKLGAAAESAHLLLSAHSIPAGMAANCRYEEQLRETCRLIASELGIPAERYQLVFQSRSGRPEDPWLEPDVVDALRTLAAQGGRAALVHPVGFLSDHMEILFDLDEEARLACDELGIQMVRTDTVGTDHRFIAMVRELIQERLGQAADKRAIGQFGPNHDRCPENCCLPTPGRPGRPPTAPVATT